MAVTFRESARHPQNQLGALLVSVLVVAALIQPGVLATAGLTLAWWHWRKPHTLALSVIVSATAVAFVIVLPDVVWAWPWRLWYGAPHAPFQLAAWGTTWPASLRSLLAEALAGPTWAMGVLLIRWTRQGMPSDLVEKERQRLEERQRQLGRQNESADGRRQRVTCLRLGVENGRTDVDLELPPDLAQHATVVGKMGSGKTTTAARLVEAALRAGWPVVIVDAKGFGSLRRFASRSAERFRVPLQLVAPDDPESLRYNPCTGTPSQVSNKLVGAFSFGDNAEIYKNIAQEVVPVLVQALRAAGREVSLASIARGLSPEGMVGLSRSVPQEVEHVRGYLADLSDRKAPYPAGYAGMRSRLNALLQGMYGQLFTVGEQATLDIASAFAERGITYISLPAMEASEDVELMARVLAQDVKQVAASRIGRGERGHALLVLDEFAALREAAQLNDLLLQAREARICCAVCTQFLPSANEASPLRHALLSAGLFISHQCSAEDAEAVAAVFGTRRTFELTQQVDYQTGTSEKGSMRQVEAYRVHPNELRDLPRGMAAVRIEPKDRRIALIQVDRPLEIE
jgi:hypothetical protein